MVAAQKRELDAFPTQYFSKTVKLLQNLTCLKLPYDTREEHTLCKENLLLKLSGQR